MTYLRCLCYSAFLFFFSCVPIQLQMHDDDLKLLAQNPTVYVVVFKPAPFEVDTSTNAALAGGILGGAVGAAVVGAVSNSAAEAKISPDIRKDPRALVNLQSYDDPALELRNVFMETLRDEFKLARFVVIEEKLDDDSPKALGDRFRDGIVLGFRTEEWILEVVVLSSNFWLRYRASGMLYWPRDNRYLWRDLCGFMPKDSSNSLAKLAANSGEGLKRLLLDTGRRRAKQLAAEIIERSSRGNAPTKR